MKLGQSADTALARRCSSKSNFGFEIDGCGTPPSSDSSFSENELFKPSLAKKRSRKSSLICRSVLFIIGGGIGGYLLLSQYVTVSRLSQVGLPGYSQDPLLLAPAFQEWIGSLGVVFLAMGSYATKEFVDLGPRTLREVGRFRGRIFMLTDQPGCFEAEAKMYGVEVIPLPSTTDVREIKSIKTQVLSFLPDEVDKALYMDVDILVMTNIHPFLLTVFTAWAAAAGNGGGGGGGGQVALRGGAGAGEHGPGSGGGGAPVLGLFEDAGAFFWGWAGFVAGSNRWNSGVLLQFRSGGGGGANRDSTERGSAPCMAAWAKEIRSGRYLYDQDALDYVYKKEPECSNFLAFPSRSLLFMKDYTKYYILYLIFQRTPTFGHFTGLGRTAHGMSWGYRERVVRPTLAALLGARDRHTRDLHLLLNDKVCSASTLDHTVGG